MPALKAASRPERAAAQQVRIKTFKLGYVTAVLKVRRQKWSIWVQIELQSKLI